MVAARSTIAVAGRGKSRRGGRTAGPVLFWRFLGWLEVSQAFIQLSGARASLAKLTRARAAPRALPPAAGAALRPQTFGCKNNARCQRALGQALGHARDGGTTEGKRERICLPATTPWSR